MPSVGVVTLKARDPNTGNVGTFSMTGPGMGTLANSGHLSLWDLTLTGTTRASNVKAAGVIDALREAGRLVPEDVVGFDDVEGMGVCPFDEPFLTTIRDPNFEMGATAAELLVEKIEKAGSPRRVGLPTELVIRGSGQGPRRGDPERSCGRLL